jgi:hypothetical protein
MVSIWLAVCGAGGVRASAPCPVPDDLAMHGLELPATKQSVADHHLVILTFGGASTVGAAAGDPNASYPAQLQSVLTAALPDVRVSVINEAVPNNTTASTPPKMLASIKKTGAKLVIWAPGARDAARRSDPTDFFDALQGGIDIVRQAGADLILFDMQYVPSMEQFSRIESYRDLLRGAASANDVPVMPRHDLMRTWHEDGVLDLEALDKTERTAVARKLYTCIAQALGASIQEAVH